MNTRQRPSGKVLLDDDARRRRWLLVEALKCGSLREAIVIARAAEAFVTEGLHVHAAEQQPVPSGRGEHGCSQELLDAFASLDGMHHYLH